MQLYQLEKIYSQMEKEFGKIRKGEEKVYSMLLFPMEENVLKIHRRFPSSNSRRLREAIALVLFGIKEKYTGEKTIPATFEMKIMEDWKRHCLCLLTRIQMMR